MSAEEASGEGPTPEEPSPERSDDAAPLEGVDAVRGALNRARAAAAARGRRPGSPLTPSHAARRNRLAGQQRRSGSGPDERDPQQVGASIGRLVDEHGWAQPVAVGGVMGRWETVVGADIAAHCTPVTFADGVLTVSADSSAWATQMRLLVPTLMRRLAEEVGPGVVTRVSVRGPSAPSWKRGPRVAPGSVGPRDTYG